MGVTRPDCINIKNDFNMNNLTRRIVLKQVKTYKYIGTVI